MALLLNIDTALQEASVSISENDVVLALEKNENQQNHTSFVQPAIKSLCSKLKISLKDFDSVAVVNGPGSYTGLRVGLASAKGICYVLHKPIILLNTLKLIALSSVNAKLASVNSLFCPMIDARRMEVFTALYNDKLEEIKKPSAEIIDETFMQHELQHESIIFSGNGSNKFREICKHENAFFMQENYTAQDVATLAFTAFTKNEFADLAYCEPFYFKAFYTKKPL